MTSKEFGFLEGMCSDNRLRGGNVVEFYVLCVCSWIKIKFGFSFLLVFLFFFSPKDSASCLDSALVNYF